MCAPSSMPQLTDCLIQSLVRLEPTTPAMMRISWVPKTNFLADLKKKNITSLCARRLSDIFTNAVKLTATLSDTNKCKESIKHHVLYRRIQHIPCAKSIERLHQTFSSTVLKLARTCLRLVLVGQQRITTLTFICLKTNDHAAKNWNSTHSKLIGGAREPTENLFEK